MQKLQKSNYKFALFSSPPYNFTYNFKVMQGLKTRYPVFSSLISIVEHSKMETTSVSHSQSTSTSNASFFTMKVRNYSNDIIFTIVLYFF